MQGKKMMNRNMGRMDSNEEMRDFQESVESSENSDEEPRDFHRKRFNDREERPESYDDGEYGAEDGSDSYGQENPIGNYYNDLNYDNMDFQSPSFSCKPKIPK
jgi:hypothetical protein